jgi:hypothetical protein
MSISAQPRSAERGLDARQLAALVRGFLESLAAAYAQALVAIEAQRSALRAADTAALAHATRQSEQAALKLSNLDQSRRELIVQAQRLFPALAGSNITTISAVIGCFDPSLATPLAKLCQSTREAGATLAASSGQVRTAVVSIAAHIQGMMQQVGKKLSHAGTYGRRGRVEQHGVVVSALDVKS